MRALVTGGAGFIGTHLVRALVARGASVRVLDDLSSGRREKLDGFVGSGSVEFLEGDIRDPETCRRACQGRSVVFHLAGLVSVARSVADPALADAINLTGSLNLLLASRDQGVRRFVFSSSAAVYGRTAVVPARENVTPDPVSPYGVQKLAGELYARNFSHLYGLETVSLRYFNVYGPGQNLESEYAAVLPRFLARLLAGEAPVVHGDGEQTRDFCYVGDVVAANILAAESENPGVPGGVFNVGSGTPTSLNTLLARMLEMLGRRGADVPAAEHAPARPGDIRHSAADLTRAGTILGYAPAYSLAAGLEATRLFHATPRPAASA